MDLLPSFEGFLQVNGASLRTDGEGAQIPDNVVQALLVVADKKIGREEPGEENGGRPLYIYIYIARIACLMFEDHLNINI